MKLSLITGGLVVSTAMSIAVGRDILTFESEKLHFERGFVAEALADKLYEDLLLSAAPMDNETMDARTINFKGDAGTEAKESSKNPSPSNLRSIIKEDTQIKESVVIHFEYLKGQSYNRTKELINDVVPNRVLEDEGTIHLYKSARGAAALANHTDTTDIFVLQLAGSKNWFLCQESGLERRDSRDKLDKCSTYGEEEISKMICEEVTLYPGDALFLPRRVVHSARALEDATSVHLTFGFAPNQCFENSRLGSVRNLQNQCNSDEGGSSCNGSCDICNEGCDNNCDPCNAAEGGTSCNESCNESCDGNCNNCPACSIAAGHLSCDANCNLSCDASCSCDGWLGSINCNTNCHSGCDLCTSSCDSVTACPPCNSFQGGSSCDTSCDTCTTNCDSGCPPCTGCDENCNKGCDSECNVCPTPEPSVFPTSAPSPAPTDPPPPDSNCFSSQATVETENKGMVRMDSLHIGDQVLTTEGTYSEVYSFAHYGPHVWTEFHEIYASGMPQPLQITGDHMLYAKVANRPSVGLVPTRELQIGDFLVTADGTMIPVMSIRKVQSQGVYAPLTKSGSLIVDGVSASSYITFKVFQPFVSYTQQHWFYHGALMPYRVYCMVVGGCGDETHEDDTGLSKFVVHCFALVHWIESQNKIGQVAFTYLVATPGHWLLLALEKMLLNWWHVVTACIGYFAWKQLHQKQLAKRTSIGCQKNLELKK